MRRSFVVVISLAACADKPHELDYLAGERQAVICNDTTLVYLGMGMTQSTNPTDARQRQHVVETRQCWMETVAAKGQTTSGSLTRIDNAPADPPKGCGFTGTGTSDHLDLADGTCVATTADGYYRFTLNKVSPMPVDIVGVEVDGTVEWSRDQDLLVGPAFIFLSVPMTPITMHPDYDMRVPADPIAGCKMPACSRVALAGSGTLLSGDPTTCADLLTGHAQPLELDFDDLDRMSFSAATPEAMRRLGVHGLDACTLDTWTGARPYPYARYHLDLAAGTVTLDEVELHQSGAITDVCATHWHGTLAGC